MSLKGREVKTLSQVINSLESGGRPKGGALKDKGIPSIGAEHLNDSGTFNFNSIKYIPLEFFKAMNTGKIKNNDILIVKDGATTGKVSFVNDDFPFKESAINEHVFIVRTDLDKLWPMYGFYFLYSSLGYNEILKDFRGSAQGGISRGFIEKVKIPILPLPIQKQIAEVLEKADKARQKRKEANKLTEQFLKSAFIEMFIKPKIGDKEITTKKLSEITTQITDGVHFKPSYQNEGIPFISVKDITTGKLSFENSKFIEKTAHINYIKRCKPEYLDILYTKVGATYGRPAIVDTNREFSLYVSVALIKPNKSLINPYYLLFAMKSDFVKHQADKSIKGIGVPDLHLVEIKKFEIIVPPLSKQKDFANLVQKVEKLKEKQKISETELENLFNSLMQKAFKGELF